MIHLKKHLHTFLIIGMLGIIACTSEAPNSVTSVVKAENLVPTQNITKSTQVVAESMTAEVKEIVVDSIQKIITKETTAPTKAAKPKPASNVSTPAKKIVSKPVAKKAGAPIIKWEKTTHDFGMIKEGDVIETNFKFKNVGNAALVIKNATASCGCTQPSYPFIPIEPGEEGYIGVVYNSRTKIGPQKPYVTITSNAKETIQKVYLKGYVEQVDTEQTTGKKKVQVIEAVPIKEGNDQ